MANTKTAAKNDIDAKTLEYCVKAAKLFAAKGYSNCGVEELAKQLGLSKGGFYWHFKSKEELYGRICMVMCRHHQDKFRKLLDQEVLSYENVIAVSVEILENMIKDIMQIKLIADFHSESKRLDIIRGELLKLDREWEKILVELSERLRVSVGFEHRFSAKQAARQCIVFFNGLLFHFNIYQDRESVIREWKTFLQGLFPQSEPL